MTINREVLEIEAAMQTILDTLLNYHARELTAAWAAAWASIKSDLELVLVDLADGGDVPGWKIGRAKRVQDGLAAANEVLEDLADLTRTTISDDAARAIGLGADGEAAMINSQLPDGHRGVVRVDDAQIRAMLDRTLEQITAVTQPVSAETMTAIRSELARGMIVGDNPREVARRMVAATENRFTGGLARALNISRTEILSAMRTAQQATDELNANILNEWCWTAHLDNVTCISCVSLHGTRYPIDEPGPDDHQSGRCARVPVTKSWAELGFPGVPEPEDVLPDSESWFDGLSAEEQRALLGKSGYEQWQAGNFPMDQWSTERENEGWRRSFVPATPPKGAT